MGGAPVFAVLRHLRLTVLACGAVGVSCTSADPSAPESSSGTTGGADGTSEAGGGAAGGGHLPGGAPGAAGTGGGGTGGDSGSPSVGFQPSCTAASSCGGGSCCESRLVPGGTFDRGGEPAQAATVADFGLDKYEVTVGRFRRFLRAYDAWRAEHPRAGEGARPSPHPLAAVSGWDSAWDAELPPTAAALLETSACVEPTWTDEPTSDDAERHPINCVTWFTAFAFCLWDGGWLPTEAEWEYAAAGGDEQRSYPWGNDPGTLGPAFPANSAHNHNTPLFPVGGEPAGDGRWGHSDLAGSVAEWTLDGYTATYVTPCVDCAQLASGTERVVRGGSWSSFYYQVTTSLREGVNPSGYGQRGIRCARAASALP